MARIDDFENHCWKDLVSGDLLKIYEHYARETRVGPAPALLAIDLYELSYQGGAKPVADIVDTYPSSCGEYAHAAIAPTRRLFEAARRANLPVFYSTQDTSPLSVPGRVNATVVGPWTAGSGSANLGLAYISTIGQTVDLSQLEVILSSGLNALLSTGSTCPSATTPSRRASDSRAAPLRCAVRCGRTWSASSASGSVHWGSMSVTRSFRPPVRSLRGRLRESACWH